MLISSRLRVVDREFVFYNVVSSAMDPWLVILGKET